ncbi:MAG: ElyC/SanA/YdcF family protein [Deltaproteobacteria bacterium]
MLFFTKKKQRLGKILALIATVALIAISYSATPNFLLKYLENQYPPVRMNTVGDVKEIKWVVALSAASYNLPSHGQQPSSSSALRVMEAVSVMRQLPQAKIIVTGTPDSTDAMLMSALVMGIKREDIVREAKSNDTKDHAKNVKLIVGKDKFVLVTSAFHMPRAMLLFRKQGMAPIPAPTNYLSRRVVLPIQEWFPICENIEKTNNALNEYYGIAYYWIAGDI